jgi:ATP-dependent HslUV protease subunit HslV
MLELHATTVLSVRCGAWVAMGSDGQVTMGKETIVKHDAKKVRKLNQHKVLVGFAGATADAFTLFDEFEALLTTYQSNVYKASVELVKKWRTDKMLRHLDAMLAVANSKCSLLISGLGDVIEASNGILAIGSGGMYARAAAEALVKHSQLNPVEIVRESLNIAAGICIYTNNNITIEELKD